MILCLGTTPAVQRVMVFSGLETGGVNRALRVLEGLGGKSLNAAKVLTQLGQPAFALGFAGSLRGEWMRGRLRDGGVQFEFIEVSQETRLCTTIVDEASGAITELVEETAPVTTQNYEHLFAALLRHLPAAKALVLSGTLAAGGPADFYARCVEAAKRAGVLSIVDAQGAALACALEKQPNVVKPNRHEIEKTLNISIKSEQGLWDAMGELIRLGAGAVVTTDGPLKVLARSGAAGWRISPPQIKPSNPIGSGDSFTAAMAMELVRGKDLGEACRAGAAAGAANALTLMTGVLDIEQYEPLRQRTRLETMS